MTNNPTPLHKLQEHIQSLAPVLGWLRAHPALDDASVAWGTRDHISLYVDGFGDRGAERFAAAVRALKDDAPLGTVRREDDDTFTRFERSFGAVTVSVFTSRATVCERVVVGTETVVETAVRCLHCGEPIGENAGYGWLHVTPDGDQYRRCGTAIDEDGNEVGGQPATPPSFAARTVEREVVEWKCSPILAERDTEAVQV